MCLSPEALMLFLSLLPQHIVETGPDRIVVHAELRDAVWLAREEEWCTAAPQVDAALRGGVGQEV
ncbi:hypothetical protein [Tropicimonas sp. IMCC6043]|uniref:hypothetical protein n=1 Tax=Tropicimonas sp. IMCC6043 TaxID=2510645 RepID=UPI00101C37A4|nr:hypothetical protein [Tropicimonas sp. IMCC6043]RYH10528.1 hypothetical protein EU800_07200 [Tropicimonas sp. IMCC6043]